MNPMTAMILDVVADSYSPLLVLLALFAPKVVKSSAWQRVVRYYAACCIGIGFVYLVKALDERFLLWSAVHLDYSTHSAFAASLVVSIAIFQRLWLRALVGSLVLYFGIILLLRYHSVPDLITAGVLSALFTGAVHWAFGAFEGGSDEFR